jgi:hypothetical protein
MLQPIYFNKRYETERQKKVLTYSELLDRISINTVVSYTEVDFSLCTTNITKEYYMNKESSKTK